MTVKKQQIHVCSLAQIVGGSRCYTLSSGGDVPAGKKGRMGRASVRKLMWPAFALLARPRSCSSIPNVSSAFAQRTASHSTSAARNTQPLLDLDCAHLLKFVILMTLVCMCLSHTSTCRLICILQRLSKFRICHGLEMESMPEECAQAAALSACPAAQQLPGGGQSAVACSGAPTAAPETLPCAEWHAMLCRLGCL